MTQIISAGEQRHVEASTLICHHYQQIRRIVLSVILLTQCYSKLYLQVVLTDTSLELTLKFVE